MIAVKKIMDVNVNFDSGLYVGMKVFFNDGSGRVQLGGIIPMDNVDDVLYVASFTPQNAGAYTFSYAVYEDSSFIVRDYSYARGAISKQAFDMSIFFSSDISGVIDSDDDAIIGTLTDSEQEII